MVTASHALDATFPRTREAEGVSDPFAPSVPLTWRYGVLRYADEPKSYRLTWWRERLRHIWYDLWKQPSVSGEPQRVFNDERQTFNSYAEARAWCRTVNCYVVAMPHGGIPLGDELFDNPTFVRPMLDTKKDAHMLALYGETDLRAHLCRELYEENKSLKAALSAVGTALDEDEHG